MSFPMSYRGEIEWAIGHEADSQKGKAVFFILLPTELRNIGLQRVFVQGERISFGGGTPRYFSQWNILTALDSGEIELHPRADALVVSYRLSFRVFFILVPVVCFLLLVAAALIGHFPAEFVPAIGLIMFAGLALIGVNCWLVVRKFSALIKRLLISIERA